MTRYRKYTYTQIVNIVGYKLVSKFDNGQISLGKFVEIFDKKLQEKNQWIKKSHNISTLS